MKKTSIILIHFLVWLIGSVIFFLFAEDITRYIYPGADSIETWLSVVALGLLSIFFIVIISLVIQLKKIKSKTTLL